jgi:predicted nucleotidyltransferase
MTDDQRKALAAYVDTVRAHYGARLVDIFVFGSRARGDHHADSDIDLAVILEDGDWVDWRENWWLAGEAHRPLLDADLIVQPVTLRMSEWLDPTKHSNPRFIQNLRADARHLESAL